MPENAFRFSGVDMPDSGDMSHADLNISCGDMQDSDSDGVSSDLEPTEIEEVGNPVAADGDRSSIIPQAHQAEAPLSVGDHNSNITGGGLRKYVGVRRRTGGWISRVCNGSHPDGKKYAVHLGTFQTAEMAAIAFDAAVLFLKGDSPANNFNFPEYSAHIKNILEGCSQSETNENIKYVAWKAAEELASLISVGNKDQGFDVPCDVSLQRKRMDERLEGFAAMPDVTCTAASVSSASPTTDIPESSRNADFPAVPVHGKQRIKASAHAASNIRAAILPTKIHDDQQETMNKISEQIQDGQPSINTSGAEDGIFPTSNANYMPKKVDSFSELIDVGKDDSMDYVDSFSELIDVEKDDSMDYGILMEYRPRHSPECLLLKPVPGANTHPDYLWKQQ